MKRILKISIVVVVALMLLEIVVNATTQSELENYLIGHHLVAGQEVRLTDANKVKVQRYLSENKITDEQASQIKAKVEELIAYMNKAGLSDVSKLNPEQKKEALSIANEALAVIGLNATYNSNDKTVEIYKEGKKIEGVQTETGKLVQTGSNNIVWITVVCVAVVALVAVVIIKKVRNDE